MAVNTKQKIMKKVKGDDTNCFFDVIREPLTNSFGLPVNFDALVRGDNHETLSVVTPKYKMTAHKEANTFVDDLLTANNIEFKTNKMAVARGGSLFQREVVLPGMKFDINTTAHDSVSTMDSYAPRIIVQNSYDRSSSLNFILGNYRFVCSNGSVFGETIQLLRFPHIKQPDYDKIGKILMESIEAHVDGFTARAKTLSEIAGTKLNPILTMLLMEVFNKKLAKKVVELSNGMVAVDYNKDGQIVDVSASKDVTAYILFNLATQAVTHGLPKLSQRVFWDKKIATAFS